MRPAFSQAIVATLGGYLGGSLPIVYLLGRSAGVDLRHVGSGNVGSHNLSSVAGPGVGLAGWMSDAAKGAAAVQIARRLTGDEAVAGWALLSAFAGQCWPAPLGWRGGRGVATFVGGMMTLTPRAAPWALAAIAAIAGLRPVAQRAGPAGNRLGSRVVPLGVLVGAALWPLVCVRQRQPRAHILTAGAVVALLVVRRITANGLPKPGRRRRVLLARILLDRDQWEAGAG